MDLSHEIVHGMTTHPGIPVPSISTFLTHEASTGRYAPGTTFEIGRIDLVANTGTYIDMPAHRFPDGQDLSGLELERVVDVDGVLVDCRGATERAIGPDAFEGVDVRGRAVLVATGWDEHWGTPAYLSDNPFLTGDAAEWLVEAGAALIGIDSLNVDSLTDPTRPAHTAILRAGIPLVEHLTGLGELPPCGLALLRRASTYRRDGDVPGASLRHRRLRSPPEPRSRRIFGRIDIPGRLRLTDRRTLARSTRGDDYVAISPRIGPRSATRRP